MICPRILNLLKQGVLVSFIVGGVLGVAPVLASGRFGNVPADLEDRKTLSNAKEELDLQTNRDYTVENIQSALLSSLNLVRGRLIDLNGFQQAFLNSPDSELIESLWQGFNTLGFSRDKNGFLEIARQDNETLTYPWVFVRNQLTELIQKTEELTFSNSEDWTKTLGSLAGDAQKLMDDMFSIAWSTATPHHDEQESAKMGEFKGARYVVNAPDVPDSSESALERAYFATTQLKQKVQQKQSSDITLCDLKSKDKPLKKLHAQNAYHTYMARSYLDSMLLSQELERLCIGLKIERRQSGLIGQIAKLADQVGRMSEEAFTIHSNPQRKMKIKDRSKYYDLKVSVHAQYLADLETLLKPHIVQMTEMKAAAALTPKSREASFAQGTLLEVQAKTHKGKEGKKQRGAKKSGLKKKATKKQSDAAPKGKSPSVLDQTLAEKEDRSEDLLVQEREYSSQVIQSIEKSSTEDRVENAPSPVLSSESQVEAVQPMNRIQEEKEVGTDEGDFAHMEESLLFRDVHRQFQNAKAMKRQQGLEALRAEQARAAQIDSTKSLKNIFHRIALKPDDFDIYYRIINRGGEVAPSWNEFVKLMRRIFTFTGGKIKNGSGAARSFKVGTRSFPVHQPRSLTDSIPEDYIKNFIQPGFEYVGLWTETVVEAR